MLGVADRAVCDVQDASSVSIQRGEVELSKGEDLRFIPPSLPHYNLTM